MIPGPATPLFLNVRDLGRVLNDPRLVLVSFEADDCDACVALGPRLDQAAEEFTGKVLVVRARGADAPSAAARHHLLWVPTLSFVLRGRERMRLDGAVSLGVLRSHLRYLLGDGPLPEPALGPRFVVQGAFRPSVHQ